MERRLSLGAKLRLGSEFIADMFDLVHHQSLKTQTAIVSQEAINIEPTKTP